MRNGFFTATAAALLLTLQPSIAADKAYGPGVSDTEVKLGQTMPYSGPASSYGTQGKTESAYLKMINEQGGVNGRKIDLISLDDGYSPPKTVEQTRKLVEEDNVLADIGALGTPTNSSIQKYLNAKKVPHLLVSTGASKWNNPKEFPWTTPFYPSYAMEAQIYGKYLLKNKPDAKIAVLYQNDDFGKDYLRGLKEGLGDKAASLIIKEVSYETTDPTIDSQIVTLQASGADTFVDITIPKFAAQAIRKTYDIGWKPMHILASVASSIGAALEPAGLDKSVGLITAVAWKTPGDPTWANDKGMQDYLAFLKKWYPEANPADAGNAVGYTAAQLIVEIVKRCGNDLTRESILKQATSINELGLPLLLPGITVSYGPTNYSGFHQLRMQRFDGKSWVLFGDVLSVASN
ncbi:MAG TPA: ABC transporter substrate-binding protein [Stellaceae bacterium]|nr:ABC transporter substrate-binding protein [Stellaceae bacterium]